MFRYAKRLVAAWWTDSTVGKRHDFTELINADGNGAIMMATIDWPAAAAALGTGLPCSGRERRILELAASLAEHSPVILCDAVTRLDDRSTRILVTAVLPASGQRQFP
jgi:hypothetical protein